MADIGSMAVRISANPSAFIHSLDDTSRRMKTFSRSTERALSMSTSFDTSTSLKEIRNLEQRIQSIEGPSIDPDPIIVAVRSLTRLLAGVGLKPKKFDTEAVRQRLQGLRRQLDAVSESAKSVSASGVNLDVGPANVDVADTPPVDVVAPTVDVPSVDVPPVDVSDTPAIDIAAPSVDAPDMPTIDVVAPSVDAPDIVTPTLDAPIPNVPVTDAALIDVATPIIDAPDTPSVDIAPPTVNTPPVDLIQLDSPPVDVPSVDVPSVDVSPPIAPPVDVPSVDLATVEVPDVPAPHVDTDALIRNIEDAKKQVDRLLQFDDPEIDSTRFVEELARASDTLSTLAIPDLALPPVDMAAIEDVFSELTGIQLPDLDAPTIDSSAFSAKIQEIRSEFEATEDVTPDISGKLFDPIQAEVDRVATISTRNVTSMLTRMRRRFEEFVNAPPYALRRAFDAAQVGIARFEQLPEIKVPNVPDIKPPEMPKVDASKIDVDGVPEIPPFQPQFEDVDLPDYLREGYEVPVRADIEKEVLDEQAAKDRQVERERQKEKTRRRLGIKPDQPRGPTTMQSLSAVGNLGMGNTAGALITLGGTAGMAALAVQSVVGGLNRLTQSAVENINAMQRLADQLESSTRLARVFDQAAAVSGRSVDTFVRASRSLRSTLDSVALGDFEAMTAFEGIDFGSINTQIPMEALQRFNDQMNALPTTVERNALAMRVFGDDWRAVTDSLNSGAIAQAQRDLDEFGLDIDTAQLERYRRETARMNLMYSQFSTFIGGELAPVMLELGKAGRSLTPVFEGVVDGLRDFGRGLSTLAESIPDEIGGSSTLQSFVRWLVQSSPAAMTVQGATSAYNWFNGTNPTPPSTPPPPASPPNSGGIFDTGISASADGQTASVNANLDTVLSNQASQLYNQATDAVAQLEGSLSPMAASQDAVMGELMFNNHLQLPPMMDNALRDQAMMQLEPEFQRIHEMERQLQALRNAGASAQDIEVAEQQINVANDLARQNIERRRELDLLRQGTATIARFRTPWDNFMQSLAHEGDGLQRLIAQRDMGAIDESTFNLGVLDAINQMSDASAVRGNPQALSASSSEAASAIIAAQREQTQRNEDPQARIERIMQHAQTTRERSLAAAEDAVNALREILRRENIDLDL